MPPELRNLKSPEKNPNKPYQNTNKPQPKHHQNQNEQIEKYKLKKTYMWAASKRTIIHNAGTYNSNFPIKHKMQ